MTAVTDQFKTDCRFRELKTFDLLFFAHWTNQDIARELGLEETAVAVIKHRFIQRVSDQINVSASNDNETDCPSELLPQVWCDGRPSCPMRTTLGKYVLGTLPEDWDDFVTFHVERLGCEYYAANLENLSDEINTPAGNSQDSLRGRILASTVGFLNRHRKPDPGL